MKKYVNLKELQKRINNLAKSCGKKRIVLYGAGEFLEDIYEELDFSELNIVAISDIKFLPNKKQDFFGIKCIPPSDIKPNDFDIILITVLKPYTVIPFLKKFIKGNSIKIEQLIKEYKPKKGAFYLFWKLFFKRAKKDNTNIKILEHLSNIEKKLSMPDNIWQIKNVKIYVPYYPIDIIQRSCYYLQ